MLHSVPPKVAAPASPSFAALLLGFASALGAQGPQPETYIAQTAGFIAPGQHVAGPGGSGYASLSPVGRIDTFVFNYVAGQSVWFQGFTGGSLDLQLRVLDPANGFTVVASSWCSGNSGSYPYPPVASGVEIALTPALALPTGAYLLEVSDYGSDETGSYSVTMALVHQPNGPMLSNGVLHTDTISPPSDLDMMEFAAVQGSLVNVFLRTHGCLDMQYWVFDASGNQVTGGGAVQGNSGSYPYPCIVSSISFNPFATPTNANAPVPTSGTYWIAVRDWGLTETGTYDVQVQCLYSPTGCPPAAGNFTLAMTQPTGHGSLAIDVTNGTPDAPYITAFSFDPINTSAPHTGWFGGLHISFPELGGIMGLGFPFLGLLDPMGQSHFATPFPFGPFPPLWAVSVELSPGYLNIVRATPVVAVNLL